VPVTSAICSMIGFGVPAGASSPMDPVTVTPGNPASAAVGSSGAGEQPRVPKDFRRQGSCRSPAVNRKRPFAGRPLRISGGSNYRSQNGRSQRAITGAGAPYLFVDRPLPRCECELRGAFFTLRLRHDDAFLRHAYGCPKNCTQCYHRSGA
jgi:hypothetical protein